ncbi:MAG: SDR family oxidoreductase, partial [Candidatus Weimeria sp.]
MSLTAEMMLFLSSDKTSFITGQNIVIDGGVTLQADTKEGAKTLFLYVRTKFLSLS